MFGISDDDEIIGVENAEHMSEIISEQIKIKMDPIPNFKLDFYNFIDKIIER